MRLLHSLASVVPALALAAHVAGAQASPEWFARPKLDAKADTNSWEAYFDNGAAQLKDWPSRAEASFYWASRLDPSRAEPYFGRWVAFHMRDQTRWEHYLARVEKVMRDPAVLAHDSLRAVAMERNPFVHRGLEVLLYDRMQGAWRGDAMTRGWLAYAKPDFREAVQYLARVGPKSPDEYEEARILRAESFVALQQLDSAEAELGLVRTSRDRRDARRLVAAYDSRELLDYATGLLHAAHGDVDGAKRYLGEAVVENAGFYPPHLWLGDLALDGGDPVGAATEYEQALAIESHDAVLDYHYGLALARLDRAPDAIAALERATNEEPYFAAPWFDLGRLMEATGDAARARAAFATFLARAPRTADARKLEVARSRVAMAP